MKGIANNAFFYFDNKSSLNVEPPMEIGGP